MEFRYALDCQVALDPANGNIVVLKTSYVALFIKPDGTMSLMTQFIEEGIKVIESTEYTGDFNQLIMSVFEKVDNYVPDPEAVAELQRQSDALLAEMNV